MVARFIPNFPVIYKLIPKMPIVQAAINIVGQDMEEIARATAPVATGKYRDSIHVIEDGDGIILVADDEKAHYIEFGTEDTPAFATLRKAAESAGQELSFDDGELEDL
jgi:pectin methylesterase-like acyl-CoA thioesterase